MKGVRMIAGKQYLLCGRYSVKAQAQANRAYLLSQWERARVVKLGLLDFAVYVHGFKTKGEA